MNFDDSVRDLLECCPGATVAAIVDPDGIPVVVYPFTPELETLGAELAAMIGEINAAGRELDHGAMRQFSVTTEKAQIVLTTMSGGYFLVLLLDCDAVTGKACFQSRLTGERLYSEFV
ncbi:MAG: roadblock/LC7 domain-containing protein [Thermoanaerobaculales bacterium]|nr:roadblock/LC7 domain-containing protein [Thermoanaerobaculales bacterium]